ncbi:MAG: hypothetical protein ACJ0S4_04840 [Candidatus Rariloculaceae bacterium]
MNKFNYFVLVTMSLVTNAFAQTDYEKSAAEADFYVTGNMVNQAMEQVNFLICWMNKTNPQNYVGAGTYLALVDQEKCRNQTGADASAEQAASKPSSANQTAAASNEKKETETVKYSETLMTITQEGTSQIGKGWAKPQFENGQEPIAYISMTQTAGVDEAAGKPFGDFEFWYEMLQPEAFNSPGTFDEPPMSIPANTVIDAGYVKAAGRDISYISESMMQGSQAVFADFSDNGDIEGVFATVGGWAISEFDFQPLQFVFQFKVDATQKAYCQKFLKAQAYTFSETDPSAAPTLTEVAESELIAAGAERVFVSSGGDFSNLTGESCFYTGADTAMRHVWRYGTYNKATGARYDLANSAFSIRADAATNSLSQDVYGWAAYWGTDYDKYNLESTDVINENTIWVNDSDATDTKEYKIRTNYVEVNKQSTEFTTLADLNGYRASVYLHDNEAYWTTQLGKLGDGTGPDSGFGDYVGSCTAAGQCQEYEGEFTYDATNPTASYFTFTHGMDWYKSGDPRVELAVPKKFTLAQWTAVMKEDFDWEPKDGVVDQTYWRNLGFWSNDVGQYYEIPIEAVKDPTSTDAAARVRTAKTEKVDLSTLAGKSFICVDRCLKTVSMNTVLQTALNQASSNNQNVIATSPYYAVGDYFLSDTYIDWNENGVKDAHEEDIQKGDSWGTGVVATDAKTYSVNTAGVLLDPDGVALTWSSATRTGLAAAVAAAGPGGRVDSVLRGQTANTKPAGFQNNWPTNIDWALSGGRLIENTATAIAELECRRPAAGKAYTNAYPGMPNDGTGSVKRYCPDAFWSGRVSTSYEVNIKTDQSYELTTGGNVVTMDRPKQFEITVPPGITDPAGKSLAGKKYRLKYEGFGELHGIPGTMINQCTGENLGDVFVEEWTSCYRYISDFTIPDGTDLTDTVDSSNVIITRALNGDEFLKGAPMLESTFTYQYTEANLPTTAVLKTTASSDSDEYIGAPPETGIINEGKAAVVNGETKFVPPSP